MIADLKPYVEYKESGLPWLGQVPVHWPVVPHRALFAEVKDRDHPGEEMLSVTITRGIVRQKTVLAGSSKKDSSNLDKSAYKLVQPRDIAYNKMRAWQGAIGASDLRGIISPAYVVMRLRKNDNLPRYFHHLYRTPRFAEEAERWSYGITSDMWSLRPEHFKMIYAPAPPAAEQAAIVRFLDWANGRLERAIRAKRKVIALLTEQKQAIIHRAVTRGLDPSVPLKPSGIPWLGDIPQHWGVLRAGLLFRAVTRRDIQADDPKLSVTQKRGLVPTNEMQENSTQARSFDHFQVCHPQDLVLNKYKAHLGVFCCAFQRGLITPNYTVLRPTRRLHTHYFDILFHTLTYRDEFSMMVYGVTEGMSPLYTQDFYRVPVILPAFAEQEAIVEKVAILTQSQNTAISRLDREIELLREYRTRLVADVVTGKLDVREAAARLPDEVEEPTIAAEGDELAGEMEELAEADEASD